MSSPIANQSIHNNDVSQPGGQSYGRIRNASVSSTTPATVNSAALTEGGPRHSASQLEHGEHRESAMKISYHAKQVVHGLAPASKEASKISIERVLNQLRSKSTVLEKYSHLASLRVINPDLLYALVAGHLTETVPILYTPGIGEVCMNYSKIFMQPEGLFISLKDKGSIKNVLRNWPGRSTARIAVCTDGGRILGLGDRGLEGMPIPVGKLSLYIAAAGFTPDSTIPIMLDVGTDNENLLNDEFYLGLRQKRPSPEILEEFMDEFMQAMQEVFPKCCVQFEDFNTPNAFKWLSKYRYNKCCFNDDIQGTASVVYSGFINAAKLSSKTSGKPLTEHKIVFFGAGSAGVGVARQMQSFFTRLGMTPEEARDRFWLVDTKGLITSDRGDKLAEHKEYFARTDNNGQQCKDLMSTIKMVKPTTLIGLSTIGGAFTEDIVKEMAKLNKAPIIFPLSNPVKMSECSFEDALNWTNGTVIFASGSPFEPIEYQGRLKRPGQGNNFFVFPGIGMGIILSEAKVVTDNMLEAAALALSDSLTAEETADELIYPDVERIRAITVEVATRVLKTAQIDKVDQNVKLRGLSDEELVNYVAKKCWIPSYLKSES